MVGFEPLTVVPVTGFVVGEPRAVVEVVDACSARSALWSMWAPFCEPVSLTPGMFGACACAVARPVPRMKASSSPVLPMTAPRRMSRCRRAADGVAHDLAVAPDRAAADRRFDESERQFGRAEREEQTQREHRPAREVDRDEPDAEPVDVDARPGDTEDRIVPEVEAVGAQTEPLQRPASERATDVRSGMYRGGDHHDRRDVDEQESAVENGEVVVCRCGEREPVDAEPVQHAERGEQHEQPEPTDGVERQARTPTGLTADAVRRERERERGTEQQAREPREGRVVREVDAAVRKESECDRRRDPDAHNRPEHAPAAEPAEPEHQQERPRQVVLLLDRERPEMLQEFRPSGFDEVRAAGDDLPPVAGVRERGEHVGAQGADRVREEEQRVRDDDGEEYVQRGQEPPRAA